MSPNTRAVLAAPLMAWGGRVRTAWWLLALVLSLALSPLLSRLHHVLHLGHGVAVMAAQAANAQEALAPAERSELDRLFGSHAEGSQVCQLLDHSSTSDGAAPQVEVPLLDLPALSVLGQLNPSCATGPVAFFQARGPPAFL